VDAIQLIQQDHRAVDQLFGRFDREARSGDLEAQRATVRDLVRALSIHASVEEEFLYPALREAGIEPEVLEALEEHHAVKLTLEELDALPPGHPRYAPKVRLLAENVRRHVREEERALLPRLRRALDDGQRRELGQTLAKARVAAPTRPHPTAPDQPPGVFVAGALAAPFDRARDAWAGGMAAARATAGDLFRAARTWLWRAERRGRAAVTTTARRGRAEAAAETGRVVQRARAAARETQQAAKGTARRARGAARKASGAARGGAEKVKKGARAATRGYAGEARPTVH
jgi:hemerythrin-like domain-containing protein